MLFGAYSSESSSLSRKPAGFSSFSSRYLPVLLIWLEFGDFLERSRFYRSFFE